MPRVRDLCFEQGICESVFKLLRSRQASTGDFNAQTFHDRAAETLATVDFLRARDDIRPDRVGLWGHSQGGMVAPLAAAISDKVAFIIEVSGWQGPAWQQDQTRVEAEMARTVGPTKTS